MVKKCIVYLLFLTHICIHVRFCPVYLDFFYKKEYTFNIDINFIIWGRKMRTLLVLTITIILVQLVIMLRLAYKNHKLCAQIQELEDVDLWHTLAFTDDLTGLHNRTAYNKHISRIEKKKTTKGLGIMIFDVDNFKEINDTKGHFEGDSVLKHVAKALLTVFPPPKYSVYRIGGDEFAVLTENTTELQLIEAMLELRNVLEKDSDITISKGYSIIQGNVKTAFKNADEMLYADKASRKKALI